MILFEFLESHLNTNPAHSLPKFQSQHNHLSIKSHFKSHLHYSNKKYSIINQYNKKLNISKIKHKIKPKHIAFILDGNRRWAKKQGLSTKDGYMEGCARTYELIQNCLELNIPCITIYGFSTENYSRHQNDISTIFNIMEFWISKLIKELKNREIKFNCIGDISKLPKSLENLIKTAESLSAPNYKLKLNIALNYGGRQDMTNCLKKICNKIELGELTSKDVNMQLIEYYLNSQNAFGEYGNPDLLIRTSGEKRISNFLLWDLAYTELYFTDVLWPDFKMQDLLDAIIDYENRTRTFGK